MRFTVDRLVAANASSRDRSAQSTAHRLQKRGSGGKVEDVVYRPGPIEIEAVDEKQLLLVQS
jgi:hypothetical protein